MKLSQQTISVMKNFASINPSLVLKPGNEIRTVNPLKTIVAIAKIQDTIPSKACIYDASRFLSICSIYQEPDIQFEDKYCTISEGKSKTRYIFADESMVILPPENEVKFPSEDVQVDVNWSDLQSVIKAAGVLNLPDIAFVGEDGVCYLRAIKSEGNENASQPSDTYGVELGKTKDTFQLIIKTENLKLMPFNYKVTLCSKGISKFESETVRYYIAVDSKKSTYKKGN
jgi:hypothetical protein